MSETRARGDDAVAVIGAGVAGVSCAVALSRALPEQEIHVFDQGSRGRGGRTSSSRPSAHDDPLVFDHGCQFFTASDPEFKAVCASLVRSGHASRWDGRFGTLDARTGAFASRDDARGDVPPDEDFFRLLSADEVFVGVPTMRGLCDGLRAAASGHLVVDHPHCAVTDLRLAPGPLPAPASTPRWTARGVDHRTLDLGARGDPERHLGDFRAVVAADVMLAKTGTPGDCALRDVPDDSVARRVWNEMADAPPDPLFTLAVAYPIDAFAAAPFDAAVVTGSPVVRLLVRDGAKPGRRARPDRLERWVAVSAASFARDVVAGAPLSVDGKYNPQTAAYLEAVTPKMVAEVGMVLALAAGNGEGTAPAPAHAATQRWGHAFPEGGAVPVAGNGGCYAWDDETGFGACGDFVGGAGVEAAWISGTRAGEAAARALSSREGAPSRG
jgi:renalase